MLPDETPSLPPRDHNQPPSPVEFLSAEQTEALQPFTQRRDELIQAAQRKQVFDRISAGDAADIIRIASEVYKRIDQDRRDRTDPYRRAADAAKGIVDEFWQPVIDALDELRQRVEAWTKAEDDRIAAQKAEQEAEMKRMREAAAEKEAPYSAAKAQLESGLSPFQPARRRKIRGDLGATLSTVEKTDFRVIDVRAVPDWIMASPTVHAAIIAVAKSMAKHTAEIPGLERLTITDNQIR